MRQIKTQTNYTRKQLVEDCVRVYIKNNPNEYSLFLEGVTEKKHNLSDKKNATLKQGGLEDDFRLAFSLPEKLHKTIETMLDLKKEERFGEVKGEMKWFSKEYPQFLIPNTY